jgi:hypothetical protein
LYPGDCCAEALTAAVALAGQTGGAVRVVLDFLFLLYQDKRKGKRSINWPRGVFGLKISTFYKYVRNPEVEQTSNVQSFTS